MARGGVIVGIMVRVCGVPHRTLLLDCPAPWQEGMRRASGVPAPADLERLYAVSPIAHVHKVKVGLRIMPLGPF